MVLGTNVCNLVFKIRRLFVVHRGWIWHIFRWIKIQSKNWKQKQILKIGQKDAIDKQKCFTNYVIDVEIC